ncbi:response regulator [Aurantimonas sp. MSK8Z-1]|uniref:response regulator n=1 Tax=Mangrovibrevibacter kandeliae TaxID=2968473 RepID=UPI00211896B9|nr:response regulator [Aurantimonas sp. MSK8Z-1]MCW4115842.1 response regulator [Aurantimonas sp. MSK8Z-1]
MSIDVRLLLIEDNPADADLTQEALDGGRMAIQLRHALDGVEALELLRRSGEDAYRPDLILLDLNLPRMDGHQFLAQLRLDPQLKPIPVVVLTSSEAPKDVSRSYQLGANCYVAKPMDLSAFQSIVKAVESFWFGIVRLPPSQHV